jgi:hypothetical protein
LAARVAHDLTVPNGSQAGPDTYREAEMAVTVDEIRALASALPRSYEAIVRGRTKFRIGQIVYLAIATDGSTMGCGFPKEFREAAVHEEPEKFALPRESDMRFNWIHVNLEAIDHDEMRDLVEGAWSRCVPKYVAKDYAEAQGYV